MSTLIFPVPPYSRPHCGLYQNQADLCVKPAFADARRSKKRDEKLQMENRIPPVFISRMIRILRTSFRDQFCAGDRRNFVPRVRCNYTNNSGQFAHVGKFYYTYP